MGWAIHGRGRRAPRLLNLLGLSAITAGLLTFLPVGGVSPASAATATTFTSDPITIPDDDFVEQTVAVSGLAGQIIDVDVRLNGVNHSLPDDLDVYIDSPLGGWTLLVADAGGSGDVSGASWTFSDDAAATPPDSTSFATGTYRPGADYSGSNPDDPSGTEATQLGSYGGENPNGSWTLRVVDDDNADNGGLITGGFSVIIETSSFCGIGGNINAGSGILSTVVVSGAPADLTDVDVVVFGIDSPNPTQIDGYISAPNNDIAYLFSDIGGTSTVSDVSVQIDDEASSTIPAPMPSGTFQVSNVGGSDPMPTGLTGTPGSTLSTLDDSLANGTWTIGFIKTPGQSHSFGGFCLDLTTQAPPNNPPVADDDSYTVAEDGTLTVPAGTGVLVGDTDSDGHSLTAGSPVGPTNGSLTLNADGSFTYTPNANFNGPDSFTYSVSDGNGGTDTGTVTITVTPVNDAPVADDDGYTVAEDGTLTVPVATGVLQGDTDIDGGALTVLSAGTPGNGGVTVNPDGSFTYTPNTNFHGADSFTYTVSDGNGGTDTGTATITVNPVNDAPIADDDSYPVAEDGSLTIGAGAGVLDGDTDVDLDTLTMTSNGSVAHGTLTVNPDGSFDYIPNADFVGLDSFTYTVSDGNGATDTGTVTIIVGPNVNDAPQAGDDAYTTDEDSPVTIPAPGVLGNDTDVDVDGLSVPSSSQPTNGGVTVNSDGSFTYTPNANFHGSDSFTYQVADGNGGLDTGTVTITVDPVADPPAAVADSYSVAENGILTVPAPGVIANDTDPDGDTLTVGSFGPAANGSVTVTPDGSFIYTPNTNFHGADSFTYEVTDGAAPATGTVTITVTPENDAPIAGADAHVIDEDVDLLVAAPGVLGNDSDIDGDSLTVSAFTQPGNGSVSVNGDGSFTYTPLANFHGADTFTYTADDGAGGTAVGTVNLTVNPVNDAPTAVDSIFTIAEDTSVFSFVDGFDVDGDFLTAAPGTGPSNGTVSVASNGGFTYWPNPDFNGSDSFTYVLIDPDGATDVGMVTIVVTPVNDAPVALDDNYNVEEDDILTVPAATGVLNGDADPDGDPLVATLLTGPTDGNLTLNTDGSFTYTPDSGFSGSDGFSYTLSDGNGGTDTADVDIEVGPIADNPQADDDSYTVAEDNTLTVLAADGVLDGDTDGDGDLLTATVLDEPADGTLTLEEDGSFTYVPDPDYSGADTFTYTVSDGNGGTDTGEVTITVTPENDPPVAVDDNGFETVAAAALNGPSVLGNDTDVDGDALTAILAAGALHGTVVLNSDGTFTYTPEAGFTGTDTFTYRASDGEEDGGQGEIGAAALSEVATVTIQVTAQQQPTTTTTTAPSTTTTTSAPAASTTTTTAPAVSGNQQVPLARTGSDLWVWQLGLVLVGAGMVAVGMANRVRTRAVATRRRQD